MERDLLHREVANVNNGYKIISRDYFLDVSLNTPNAIIDAAAVKPFSPQDRALLYTAILPLKPTFIYKTIKSVKKKIELPSIEGCTKKNAKATTTILGVDVIVFIDRLKKYVDLPTIEKELLKAYPALVINKSILLNEVVTEAVHQLQAKLFMDKSDWDGIIGPAVISSMGFVFHERKTFTAAMANDKIKKLFKKLDTSIKDYVVALPFGLPDINGSNWFDFILNPTLFGQTGTKGYGFHLFLVLKLRTVENDLYPLLAAELSKLYDKEIAAPHTFTSATYGQVPRLLGKALGIEQKHGDIRSVSTATPLSRHLSGIAIDINYTGNPWVRGAQGLKMINKALAGAKKPLIDTKKFSTAQQYFANLASTSSTAVTFDTLKAHSDDCVTFLKLKSVDWGASKRSPNRGFLNLRKEIVVALRDTAGLAWGAVDLGTGSMGNGDIMHFDMRTSSIGQAYSKEIGQDDVNDYLQKVHPNFQRVSLSKATTSTAKQPKKDKEYVSERERDILFREVANMNDGAGYTGRDFDVPLAGTSIVPPYGGLNLQLGDNDTKRWYEGTKTKRTDVNGNPVRQLQTDLKVLGIGLIGTPDGDFGFNTECAVREFQIYAKMPQIAHQVQGMPGKILLGLKGALPAPNYGDDFWVLPNPDKYTGEVNGVVNSEVRRLITKWKDNDWRVPVVVQAWNMKKGARDTIFSKKDNIWKYNEVKSTAPRMYVKDLTGYYPFPATRKPTDLVVLGDYAVYGSWGGPSSEKATKSWSETELTPDFLLGKSISKLSASELSTFMVIRAVSQVECIGHLDRMNAYDNAFVSFGPFHWVLGLAKGMKVEDGGEISSFIAYLKEKNKTAYDQAFGFFGLDGHKAWNKSGQDFFYSGGIRNYGKGRPALKRGSTTVHMEATREGFELGNYLRSWHWFYRFVMAARTISGFAKATWDFARLRIRDISSIEVKDLGITDSKGKALNPTLAALFTSERAFALILRLHVRYPSHVANVNNQTVGLKTILENSLKQIKKEKLEEKDFSKWGQRHQDILIDNIINNYPATKGIHQTLETVRDFTYNSTALSSASNSFAFNADGLPPAPIY